MNGDPPWTENRRPGDAGSWRSALASPPWSGRCGHSLCSSTDCSRAHRRLSRPLADRGRALLPTVALTIALLAWYAAGPRASRRHPAEDITGAGPGRRGMLWFLGLTTIWLALVAVTENVGSPSACGSSPVISSRLVSV